VSDAEDRAAASAQDAAALASSVQELMADAAAERERCARAVAETAEVQALLRKERESAVEVMSLLSKVQERFSGGGRPAANGELASVASSQTS
jgi:hypothetical protein